ncbi:CLUMA_CG020210, isoform A [Clunio marinus]|uniref:CLUMA_CG020210, isoform A n=1 Tax=Clunio marinus TaxID=568069 RepID=A0A1J1J499_9DIPT|nr:CLUMA_CG020210, isoform A [Clunio marinus]
MQPKCVNCCLCISLRSTSTSNYCVQRKNMKLLNVLNIYNVRPYLLNKMRNKINRTFAYA